MVKKKWKLVYTRQAQKDAKKIANADLKDRAMSLLENLSKNPYSGKYKKLVGDLSGAFSRRINLQHSCNCGILRQPKNIYPGRPKEHIIQIFRGTQDL